MMYLCWLVNMRTLGDMVWSRIHPNLPVKNATYLYKSNCTQPRTIQIRGVTPSVWLSLVAVVVPPDALLPLAIVVLPVAVVVPPVALLPVAVVVLSTMKGREGDATRGQRKMMMRQPAGATRQNERRHDDIISKNSGRLIKFSLRIHLKNGYQCYYATIFFTVAFVLPP